MKIAVPIMMVPDLVEELEIDPSGKALDMTWARLKINEFDDHAIEQAILLKERVGGEVTILAFDSPDVDDVLFTAAAKGADHLIKLEVDPADSPSNHARAQIFAKTLQEIHPDVVLVGVQAHNDLDGQVGPLLAAHMGIPYLGYIAGMSLEGDTLVARKEYPGGLAAQMEVDLPAVLGIQAADEPPRYVAFSRVRQAMKTASIKEKIIEAPQTEAGVEINRMFLPEAGQRAIMIQGEAHEVAGQIMDILKDQGLA